MKFGRFLLWIIRPLFYILFPYKVRGMENVPKEQGPLVLCCNHISNLDPVFLLLAFKKRPIFFMAKAELFKNRITAWLFSKVFGAFPVNRGKGDTESLKTAERLVNEGKLMGVFPEGTRSKDGKLGRGKSGAALIAFRTGASVLPAAIKTKNQKIRPFRKTCLYIGKVMTPEELRLTGEDPNYRHASRMIMERIAGLLEENS